MAKAVIAAIFLVVGIVLSTAASGASPHSEFGPDSLDSIRWRPVQSGGAIPAGKKDCAAAYPTPEAAKHWTGCKSGEYSQCGGPPDCACSDDDDRLVWYHCKEGSYAICEDDNSCKEGS